MFVKEIDLTISIIVSKGTCDDAMVKGYYCLIIEYYFSSFIISPTKSSTRAIGENGEGLL